MQLPQQLRRVRTRQRAKYGRLTTAFVTYNSYLQRLTPVFLATLRRVFYIVDTTSRTIKHGFLRTLDKLSPPRARRRTIYAICRRAINPHLRTRPPTACTTAAASFKSALFSLASAIARRYRGNGAIRICGGRNCPRAICTLWVRLFLRNTAHQRAMFSLPSATCEHTRALWASAIARRYRGNGAIRICRAPISAKYGAPF